MNCTITIGIMPKRCGAMQALLFTAKSYRAPLFNMEADKCTFYHSFDLRLRTNHSPASGGDVSTCGHASVCCMHKGQGMISYIAHAHIRLIVSKSPPPPSLVPKRLGTRLPPPPPPPPPPPRNIDPCGKKG